MWIRLENDIESSVHWKLYTHKTFETMFSFPLICWVLSHISMLVAISNHNLCFETRETSMILWRSQAQLGDWKEHCCQCFGNVTWTCIFSKCKKIFIGTVAMVPSGDDYLRIRWAFVLINRKLLKLISLERFYLVSEIQELGFLIMPYSYFEVIVVPQMHYS